MDSNNSGEVMAIGIENVEVMQRRIRNVITRLTTGSVQKDAIDRWAKGAERPLFYGAEPWPMWTLSASRRGIGGATRAYGWWELRYRDFTCIDSEGRWQDQPLSRIRIMYYDLDPLVKGIRASFPDISVATEPFFESAGMKL